MPLHATEPEARLAPVAQRYRETRHACGQTNGGDDQPTILTVEASRTAKSAEIQRSPRFGRELWATSRIDKPAAIPMVPPRRFAGPRDLSGRIAARLNKRAKEASFMLKM
jgi:hypothetical protein